ncbi:daptide-type RiPP biosynthesis methyltransferase [Georgenia sp. AZ-5]|uniref:daptide-type RiPP biosynthesis methyltransferase n=1 Tax=Georgenia sp. AZ-5 TaxID=3367526 RepID=UPI0037548EA8
MDASPLTTARPGARLALAAPRVSLSASHGIPGRAGRTVAALGARAEVHGICDEAGSALYADLVDSDMQEIRAVLRAVLQVDGPVLDLAAGVGRLTVPLLALRREVTALDVSRDALRGLAGRLLKAPAPLRERCAMVQADMAGFALGRLFGAVVLAGCSVALLDETGRVGLYGSVRDHLAPGGRFLVSTVDHGALPLPPEVGTEVHAPSGRTYRMYEYWEPDAPTWTLTALPKDRRRGQVTVCTTTQRVLCPGQLEAELERAGFVVAARTQVTEHGYRQPLVLLDARVA